MRVAICGAGAEPWIWNAPACSITCIPETMLTAKAPGVALGVTTTSAARCVGLNTQTRLTVTSLDPNPTDTWPSTNCVPEVTMSTLAERGAPNRAVETGDVMLWICGVPLLGYV